MQCSEAQELLSAFHDRELSRDCSLLIEAHLAECDACRRDLMSLERLSEIAVGLRTTGRPKSSWQDIESQLDLQARKRVAAEQPLRRRFGRRTAGLILASTAILALLFYAWPGDREHDHLAANFDEFLQLFDKDVDAAQALLLTNYNGRPTTVADAAAVLKYTPVVSRGMPKGFQLEAAYLLKMPCCTCMQAVFVRPDGSCICVFEHEQEQPIWFGRRPAISGQCQGKPTRLVQIDGMLAASCLIGKRHVTIIGAASLEEVSELVGTFIDGQAG